MKIKIKLLPSSSQNKIMETMAGGALKIKLTAPPVEGKANKALIKFLSKHYKTPQTKIKIVSGLTSKNKIVEIESERL